jgi:hypothetical protein
MPWINFPRAWPVLHVLLALKGIADAVELLVVDEHFQAVLFGKSVDQPFAMHVGSARQIARDPGIESPVAPVRHDVNDAAFHAGN